MSNAEKALRRFGAVPVPARRHKVYMLAGVRFTLHSGTRPNPREEKAIMCRLRQLQRAGLLEGDE